MYPQRTLPTGAGARSGHHVRPDEYGITVYNTCRTCPVQNFGHAGTYLGRPAGRDPPGRGRAVVITSAPTSASSSTASTTCSLDALS